MRIIAVEAIALRASEAMPGSADSAHTAAIVRVHTDEGLIGVAECDHAPETIRVLLHAPGSSSWSVGIENALIGHDPLALEEITARLYRGNVHAGRRGLGLALLNAIDVALWDIRAQAQNEPLWQTLWGAGANPPRPYATLYTGPGEFDESVTRLQELLERTAPLGFDAVKVEPLDDCVPEERIEDFVAAARSWLGEHVELLVDFGHRFESAEVAAAWIERLVWTDPSLIETPLWVDDLAAYSQLAELSAVPIAASELYESYWEFHSLIHLGRIGVVQPWVNRVGVSGTLRVAQEAREAGRRCVLAGWNATSIGVAVNVHVAAGLGGGIVLEHAPVEVYDGFPLRPVASPEPRLEGGAFQLPTAPGLGVEVDHELLDMFASSETA